MDNHHVQIWQSNASCGVIELSGISSDPRKVLYAIATYLYHPARGVPASAVVWSDLTDDNGVSNGEKLFRFIREKFEYQVDNPDLKPIFVKLENPKTSNLIGMWVWIFDHNTFKDWYRLERIARANRVGA